MLAKLAAFSDRGKKVSLRGGWAVRKALVGTSFPHHSALLKVNPDISQYFQIVYQNIPAVVTNVKCFRCLQYIIKCFVIRLLLGVRVGVPSQPPHPGGWPGWYCTQKGSKVEDGKEWVHVTTPLQNKCAFFPELYQ